MTVLVNQEEHQVLDNHTLQQLVEQLQIATNGIAIAINNQVIQKSNWKVQLLKHQDNILIIKSTQGG